MSLTLLIFLMTTDVSNAEIYRLLQAQDKRMDMMVEEMKDFRGEIKEVRSEMKTMRQDFKADIHELKQDMHDIRQSVCRIETRVDQVDDRVYRIDNRLHQVEDRIDGIRITWDNRLIGSTVAASAITAGAVAVAISVLI